MHVKMERERGLWMRVTHRHGVGCVGVGRSDIGRPHCLGELTPAVVLSRRRR